MQTLIVTSYLLILSLLPAQPLALCRRGPPAPPSWTDPRILPPVTSNAWSIGSSPAHTPEDEALLEFDRTFVQMYDAARSTLQQYESANDPILIVYSGRHAVLLHHNTRVRESVEPPAVPVLKTFAHAALAVIASFLPHVLHPWSNALNTTALLILSQKLRAALQDGDASWRSLLTAEQLERQARMSTATLTMIEETLVRGSVTYTDVKKFSQIARPWAYANIVDCAQATVDLLHEVVQVWRAEMGEEAWCRLRAAVAGSHMAREGDVTLQYLLHALGEEHEGTRVVFAEGDYDDARVLHLMAVHNVDNLVGELVFDDRHRMHRDIMADAAASYLNVIPGGGGADKCQ